MNNAISNARPGGKAEGAAGRIAADIVLAELSRPPVLAATEAGRRAGLLCDLQAALAARGVSAVLARNHRLVLRGGRHPCGPSGPTDPQLHVFTPAGTRIITTDGTSYLHGDGTACPADDPPAQHAHSGPPPAQAHRTNRTATSRHQADSRTPRPRQQWPARMAREAYVNQASDRAPAQTAPCGNGELLATLARNLQSRGLECRTVTYPAAGPTAGHVVEIVVTNPAAPQRGEARIGDDGGVTWEYFGKMDNAGVTRILDDITNALRATGLRSRPDTSPGAAHD